MKTNELMIGDYLQVEPSGMAIRINAIREKMVGYHTCEGRTLFVLKEIVHPIPLTPEILEKNGFKKYNFREIEGQHQWVWWIDTLSSLSLWCRELNDNPKDGWMTNIESRHATCRCKVNCVHELQHALRLCGIEKEIVL